MAVKIGSAGAPASPFELLRGTSDHPRDKELTFESELMDQQSEGVSHEEMEAMLKKIDEQAARLGKTPTYDELKEYRTLIKNFVGAAVSNMYEVHTSHDRSQNRPQVGGYGGADSARTIGST